MMRSPCISLKNSRIIFILSQISFNIFSFYHCHALHIKNRPKGPARIQYGAGAESRTLITSLENLDISRYTIPALSLLYHSHQYHTLAIFTRQLDYLCLMNDATRRAGIVAELYITIVLIVRH